MYNFVNMEWQHVQVFVADSLWWHSIHIVPEFISGKFNAILTVSSFMFYLLTLNLIVLWYGKLVLHAVHFLLLL